MIGKAKIQNSNVWKSQKPEFQCLEKPKTRIPMFEKAKIQSSSVWKSQKPEFQCLEKHIDILRSLNKGVFERCTKGCGC